MIALKDEADVFAVNVGALLAVHFVDWIFQEVILARPAVIEHANDAQEGGFACSGRAHDSHKFPFSNFETNTAQDVGHTGAGFEGLLDII